MLIFIHQIDRDAGATVDCKLNVIMGRVQFIYTFYKNSFLCLLSSVSTVERTAKCLYLRIVGMKFHHYDD